MPAAPSMKSSEEAIAKVRTDLGHFSKWIAQRNRPQFDSSVMSEARVVDASPEGTVVFEMDVGEQYSNLRGIMHGAAATLIFDNLTSAAFLPMIPPAPEQLRLGKGPPGGVTRAMNVTYLRPCPTPSTVRVECQVVQHGRSASLVMGKIASGDGQRVYFTCEHHKIAAPTQIQGSGGADGVKRASRL